jgi:formylmethanofuran dehydrogenase subunit C
MKNIITFCLSVCLIVTLAACSLSSLTSSSAALATQVVIASSSDVSAVSTQETLATVDPVDVDYDDDDFETNASEADVSFISLEGETITLTGVGAEVSSSTVTITSAGTYRISGTLNDGQIIVDTADSDSVVPILDGVDLTSTTSAPIYVRSADKTIITLADGTQNIVTDGTSYVFDDAEAGEPDAAIFSKDDLTINGRPGQNEFADSGNYHLYIYGGYVFIDAEGDGLDANGAIDMTGGTVIVNGPTGNNNGALDYMGSFNLRGGAGGGGQCRDG